MSRTNRSPYASGRTGALRSALSAASRILQPSMTLDEQLAISDLAECPYCKRTLTVSRDQWLCPVGHGLFIVTVPMR